jgi:hypothetical protein
VAIIKKGQIKKIYQWVGLSHGNEITEYYFKDGQLTFAYQKFISFSYNEKKGEMDYNKIKTTFEGRYYYNHKKLINSIFSGHNRSGENSSGTAKRLRQNQRMMLRCLARRYLNKYKQLNDKAFKSLKSSFQSIRKELRTIMSKLKDS